jgi:YHS domain-containing protein
MQMENLLMADLGTRPLPDPIGGIWLEPENVVVTFTYLGQTYAFCCTECCSLFSGWPELYVEHVAHEPCWPNRHECPFGHRTDN